MILTTGWQNFLDARQELDLQPGWRSEIVEWNIVLSPPQGNRHNLIAARVHRALAATVPDDWAICQVLPLAIPHLVKLFVPDVAVVPFAELANRPDAEPVPAGAALLAVEITMGSSADVDRATKRSGYADAGVPIYLLIDRFHDDGPSVSLLTRPVDGHYKRLVRVEFGEKVAVPEPFGFELDTSEF